MNDELERILRGNGLGQAEIVFQYLLERLRKIKKTSVRVTDVPSEV
jgi:hypothetical protein